MSTLTDDVGYIVQKFGELLPLTLQITELICIPRYLYLAKIDLHICIRRAAIQKRHEALES